MLLINVVKTFCFIRLGISELECSINVMQTSLRSYWRRNWDGKDAQSCMNILIFVAMYDVAIWTSVCRAWGEEEESVFLFYDFRDFKISLKSHLSYFIKKCDVVYTNVQTLREKQSIPVREKKKRSITGRDHVGWGQRVLSLSAWVFSGSSGFLPHALGNYLEVWWCSEERTVSQWITWSRRSERKYTVETELLFTIETIK